jgi:hypothetical protein
MPTAVKSHWNQPSAVMNGNGPAVAPPASPSSPNTTPSPPRTHSTIRAQLRPFQANQMNSRYRARRITESTIPIRRPSAAACSASMGAPDVVTGVRASM